MFKKLKYLVSWALHKVTIKLHETSLQEHTLANAISNDCHLDLNGHHYTFKKSRPLQYLQDSYIWFVKCISMVALFLVILTLCMDLHKFLERFKIRNRSLKASKYFFGHSELVFAGKITSEKDFKYHERKCSLYSTFHYPAFSGKLFGHVVLYCTYMHPYIYTVSRTTVQLLHRM